MSELVLNIRQDVFGILASLKKSQVEAWWLLVRLKDDNELFTAIPSKLRPDMRALVAVGLVLESDEGFFRINPDIAFTSEEPTMDEIRQALKQH